MSTDKPSTDSVESVVMRCGMPCHRCIRELDLRDHTGSLPLNNVRMILCETCGNKRCPHASDHRLACSGRNNVGQDGSIYRL